MWNTKLNNDDLDSKKSDDDHKSSDGGKFDKEGRETATGDKEFLVNLETVVKKESDDDEREEGEIQETDDDNTTECGKLTRRRSSSNPVNLSLNTKSQDDINSNKENPSADGESSNEVSIL